MEDLDFGLPVEAHDHSLHETLDRLPEMIRAVIKEKVLVRQGQERVGCVGKRKRRGKDVCGQDLSV